jgi:uroporphyrinogen-III synthase
MDDLPFRGQTFLVVTSEDLADKVARSIREKGGQAIPFPTIRVVPPNDYADLDRGIRLWRTLDWVVFTSAHGVEAVVDRSKTLAVDLTPFPGNVAAVGPATRAAAEAAGLRVSVIPEEFLTDAIAGALGDVCGRTVFLPRSRIARKRLADELRERGANVIEADAYDAIPTSPEVDLVRKADRIDVVLFTSASAATHLIEFLPDDLRDRLLKEAEAACIGPVTAEAARSLGFRVSTVARDHTVRGLVERLGEVRAHG